MYSLLVTRSASALVNRHLVLTFSVLVLALVPLLLATAAGFYPYSLTAFLADSLGFLLGAGLLTLAINWCTRKSSRAWPLEPYIILSLVFLTYSLARIEHFRGTFLIFYALLLMLGIFQVRPVALVRCAFVAYGSYVVLCIWLNVQSVDTVMFKMMVIQSIVLAIALFSMVLFARYHQRIRRQLKERRDDLEKHQEDLRHVMRQLETQVITDELTGLRNRRYFLQIANEALHRLGHGRMHGLALIDMDYFKQINDQFGHGVGDLVLKAFASVGLGCIREQDVLARYGGEEFVLLLPLSDKHQLVSCCDRLRQAFASAVFEPADVGMLTVSIGMSLIIPGRTLDEALQLADQALYCAKRNGRNRCEISWET
jgi:diguanylate cyclase (GGDEF)-like protein